MGRADARVRARERTGLRPHGRGERNERVDRPRRPSPAPRKRGSAHLWRARPRPRPRPPRRSTRAGEARRRPAPDPTTSTHGSAPRGGSRPSKPNTQRARVLGAGQSAAAKAQLYIRLPWMWRDGVQASYSYRPDAGAGWVMPWRERSRSGSALSRIRDARRWGNWCVGGRHQSIAEQTLT